MVRSRFGCGLIALAAVQLLACSTNEPVSDDPDPANPEDGGVSSAVCGDLAVCCPRLDGDDQDECNAIVSSGSGAACQDALNEYNEDDACEGMPLEASTLFGACLEDWQCPGEGAVCRPPTEGYPQGYCTRPCPGGDRGPCDLEGILHHCVEVAADDFWCERRCQNGIDCGREAYTCETRADLTGGGVCIGVCTSDDDCGGGAECNIYSGECLPAGTVPTAGSTNGGDCLADGDCLSNSCNLATNGANPTGWVDGYCLGACILPFGWTSTALWSVDENMPSGTCPESDVCYPNGSYTEGDPGVCLRGCTEDSECRTEDGYVCRKEWALRSGTVSYDRGVCWPIANCQTTPCPEGLTCRAVSTPSGTAHLCSR